MLRDLASRLAVSDRNEPLSPAVNCTSIFAYRTQLVGAFAAGFSGRGAR
jgi:hypothetical protein